ncbi:MULTISPECIES: hypothetical protein [Bacteroidota]|uniref:Uncharacterized protein n=1 Tax=Euzebyella saccharophila TaxID=679664 RepID=A0ABV8JN31_9FLAO|nr:MULTISPECIES: hypothetical protein [Bacteroidota]MBC6997532.1 hypothetical protein [Cytophaga sp. FL35]
MEKLTVLMMISGLVYLGFLVFTMRTILKDYLFNKPVPVRVRKKNNRVRNF